MRTIWGCDRAAPRGSLPRTTGFRVRAPRRPKPSGSQPSRPSLSRQASEDDRGVRKRTTAARPVPARAFLPLTAACLKTNAAGGNALVADAPHPVELHRPPAPAAALGADDRPVQPPGSNDAKRTAAGTAPMDFKRFRCRRCSTLGAKPEVRQQMLRMPDEVVGKRSVKGACR